MARLKSVVDLFEKLPGANFALACFMFETPLGVLARRCDFLEIFRKIRVESYFITRGSLRDVFNIRLRTAMSVPFDRFTDILHSLPIVPRRRVPSFGSQRSEVEQQIINL